MERLVLGTAQLGMNYGIANKNGQPDFPIARAIIEEAWRNGICEFDTAQAYGESERVLGQVFQGLGISDEVKIITKLDPTLDYLNKGALLKAFETSLYNLGVKSIFGLMFHKEDVLELWNKGLERDLMDLVDSGRVEHIGVSVYSPGKAIQALNTQGISIVQFPGNVIDRRFERAGVFDIAEDKEKKIYIRSIFLQGLLVLSPESLPQYMRFAAPVLNKLTSFVQETGLSIKELCIGYIKHAFPHSSIIFGVETLEQLKENVQDWDLKWSDELTEKIRKEFYNTDEMILNPSLWPKGNAGFHS